VTKDFESMRLKDIGRSVHIWEVEVCLVAARAINNTLVPIPRDIIKNSLAIYHPVVNTRGK
jgi:hypothetical protein